MKFDKSTAQNKEIFGNLSAIVKHWIKYLFFISIIIVVSMISAGASEYIPALFIGYFVAIIYFFTLISRVLRMMNFSASVARRVMLFGFVLRFIALGAIFGVAARISTQLFIVTILGFALAYLLGMLELIAHNKFR